MKNIESIINNLSSRVDLKNPRTITLIAAAVIIIFAILYVYQSRRLLEGFESYYVTGANDTVTLGSLDKVKVGSVGLMEAITNDATFKTRVAEKVTEAAGFNDFVTFKDLTDNLNTYATFGQVTSTINQSLGNYLKKSDIINSSELTTLIQNKIQESNTEMQRYVNSQIPENLKSIPKLIGIIHGFPLNYDTYWGTGNISTDGTVHLGYKSDKRTAFNCSPTLFSNQFSIQLNDVSSSVTPNLASIICLFDWKYDKNIFINKYLIDNVTSKFTVSKGNIGYTNVYPNNNSTLTSPFPNIKIESNVNYLVNLNFSSLYNFGWGVCIFYVLFKGNESNTTYDVNFVEKHFPVSNCTDISSQFIIQTTSDTFNIGIYCTGFHLPNVTSGNVGHDYRIHTGVTIYELPYQN